MTQRDELEQADRDNTADAIRKTKKHLRDVPLMERLRKIVDEKTAARVDGILVDLFSASAVIKVYDALGDENKKKYAAMPLRKMVSVAFKLLK